MKNKVKKIALVAILVFIVIAIVFVVINSSSGKKEAKVANNDTGKLTQNLGEEEAIETVDDSLILEEDDTTINGETTTKAVEVKPATVTDLKTGTKYSVDNSISKADIIVGDNYYGTQIADITLNFSEYEGKTIEIEGLYFENSIYTFVGRYSTSSVCPSCPAGYSYFEYEWHGDKDINLTDSDSWIKVIGTLKEGHDETGEYYYIDVASLEVMKTKGILTVDN